MTLFSFFKIKRVTSETYQDAALDEARKIMYEVAYDTVDLALEVTKILKSKDKTNEKAIHVYTKNSYGDYV